MRIVEMAPAKLNLGLKILGRRPDGYRDILSVFQTVDLCDRLILKPDAEGQTRLVCSDPSLPTGDDNLVCRAVAVFRRATGDRRGVHLTLEKHIPVGAGLGGGSSDAAAVLRGLNQMWQAGFSPEALCALGAQLGSDVPFLMRPGTAIVTGRGEQVRYVAWRSPVVYVLVYPGFSVSTAWAYNALSQVRENGPICDRAGRGIVPGFDIGNVLTEASEYANFLNSMRFDGISARDLAPLLENDFLPIVANAHPHVFSILEQFRAGGALAVSMSGSGSTLYGVYDSRETAEAVRATLQALGHRVFLCRPHEENA